MDFNFDCRHLHLPLELIGHICQFLEVSSDICAARLVNKCFCSATTPLITNTWDSPSLLFERSHPSPGQFSYDGTGIDPENRPRWVESPFTTWTTLRIPSEITLEDHETAVGKRFRRLLNAPSGLDEEEDDCDDDGREAFDRFGRKAVSWGRVLEEPELFFIVMQFDCRTSWRCYRNSEEAAELRKFLLGVAPENVDLSTSGYIPIAADVRRCRPLFDGYYEIRTKYFHAKMSRGQKRAFETTQGLYRVSSMINWEHHLGLSPWWWVSGLRTFKGTPAVAACFAFFWKSQELEEVYKESETRPLGNASPQPRVVDVFEEEQEAAGAIGVSSVHCTFSSGVWRN